MVLLNPWVDRDRHRRPIGSRRRCGNTRYACNEVGRGLVVRCRTDLMAICRGIDWHSLIPSTSLVQDACDRVVQIHKDSGERPQRDVIESTGTQRLCQRHLCRPSSAARARMTASVCATGALPNTVEIPTKYRCFAATRESTARQSSGSRRLPVPHAASASSHNRSALTFGAAAGN